jgi:phosphoribosylformylglycinamidine synthase
MSEPRTTRLRVTVLPKEGVLDPQGKAIGRALAGLGFQGVDEVRVGKVVLVDMARRLLANSVIESFRVEIA